MLLPKKANVPGFTPTSKINMELFSMGISMCTLSLCCFEQITGYLWELAAAHSSFSSILFSNNGLSFSLGTRMFQLEALHL